MITSPVEIAKFWGAVIDLHPLCIFWRFCIELPMKKSVGE